jgi:hypothetical protein
MPPKRLAITREGTTLMKYVVFFAVLVPLQLLVVVSALRVIRRRRPEGETDSWLRLTGKVFALMLAVNALALIPGIGLAAVVVWLVGLMRLSGLDVLATFILSFTLGVINFAGMVVLAHHLAISFPGA